VKRYNPKEIEPRWQKQWAESKLYAAVDFDEKRPKYVMLTEFPYPSGDGLHLGHVREYTLGDIMARHKRMNGYNVLYQMGYDAFGLPTENYAIKNKIAPQVATEQNVGNFQKQFDSLGYSIDWDRSFRTTDPNYYKWTQWLFLKFFEAGLAYQAEIAINWCPKCRTGLANEEVVNGKHERCDTPVEKKFLKQWLLKITQYADRLIEGLASVDYPSKIADQQINWIGKSKGAEIDFAIDGSDKKLRVFTTRPDTLFGATFMVVAPEHPLVAEITSTEQKQAVDEYVRIAQSKSEIERQDTEREKTGVFTGAYAINPVNDAKIPVWIADYVLYGYGTGAIMAVPAHDERDMEFAIKFQLPITQVVMPIEDDSKNPPQPHFEEVVRDTVIVHLKDKSSGKYALLDWHGTLEGITTAIMGGIENGQSAEEAALSEIREETALDNVKIVKKLRWVTGARYCASHKQQNRKAITTVFLAEVGDLNNQGKIAEDEAKHHTLVWVNQQDVLSRLIPDHQKLVWQQLWNETAIAGEGELMNSGEYNGMSSSEAREKIVADLAKRGMAEERSNYRLRDWIFSRQHYWGEPIPIIHCPQDGVVAVPYEQLPVELPAVEHYEPTETGESPLAAIDEWVNVSCPKCGKPAKRETDTMPNWAGSSWYYLRYYDAHNGNAFADKKKLEYWGAVDMYLGGMEHTTLHLLYSRFWHQFFYDQGLVPTPEPYKARRGQGIILATDGTKMSKSKGNVVNPTDIIEQGYGADSVRLSIAFLAPYDQTTPWNPEGVAGTFRFLQRGWTLIQEHLAAENKPAEENTELNRAAHKAIKRVSVDLHEMGFNTAIAALMEFMNELYKLKITIPLGSEQWANVLKIYLQLLAPFAPHIADELWQQLGEKDSIHNSNWPLWDEALLVQDSLLIAVQVNGKVRGTVSVPSDATEEQVIAAASKQDKVAEYLAYHEIKKTIYVPKKLISFVI
jgi:leucyl-tRNA synthetase